MQIVMGGLSWWHWIIILGAFVLLFGAKKLPDAARGVGRSLRILKSEVSAMSDDDKARTEETAAVAPVVLTAPTPVVPAVLSPAAVLPTDPATVGVAPASTVSAGRS